VRQLARNLIRLYPANWRERYGEEFEALLEDSSPGWSAVIDLLKGAVKMQFNVRSFPKLAGGLALCGLLAGLAISFLVTPRYVSQAALRVTTGPGRSLPFNPAERLMQMQQEILSRTSLSRIIQDPRLDLYRNQRARMPLEDVIEQMRTRDIQIRIESPGTHLESLAFNISFAYKDPVKAQQTVQALITRFVDSNLTTQRNEARVKQATTSDQIYRMEMRIAALERRLGMPSGSHEPQNQLDPRIAGINLEVIDPPSLPVAAVYPDRFRFMSIGFGAGLAAALIIVAFRRKLPPIPFPAQTA
jgi:uncharacterized protein involved in exopolysaccharide biosynthesis